MYFRARIIATLSPSTTGEEILKKWSLTTNVFMKRTSQESYMSCTKVYFILINETLFTEILNLLTYLWVIPVSLKSQILGLPSNTIGPSRTSASVALFTWAPKACFCMNMDPRLMFGLWVSLYTKCCMVKLLCLDAETKNNSNRKYCCLQFSVKAYHNNLED